MKAGIHLRVARPTDAWDEILRFYRDGLGFEVIDSFTDHDGFTKPMAYVVLRRGFAQSDALIAELCAEVRPLGGYKVPECYEFIDELPRTTLMKIDRRALRERR